MSTRAHEYENEDADDFSRSNYNERELLEVLSNGSSAAKERAAKVAEDANDHNLAASLRRSAR